MACRFIAFRKAAPLCPDNSCTKCPNQFSSRSPLPELRRTPRQKNQFYRLSPNACLVRLPYSAPLRNRADGFEFSALSLATAGSTSTDGGAPSETRSAQYRPRFWLFIEFLNARLPAP